MGLFSLSRWFCHNLEVERTVTIPVGLRPPILVPPATHRGWHLFPILRTSYKLMRAFFGRPRDLRTNRILVSVSPALVSALSCPTTGASRWEPSRVVGGLRPTGISWRIGRERKNPFILCLRIPRCLAFPETLASHKRIRMKLSQSKDTRTISTRLKLFVPGAVSTVFCSAQLAINDVGKWLNGHVDIIQQDEPYLNTELSFGFQQS